MTKFGNNLIGSDRHPAKFARRDPHPEIPFEADKPTWPWSYFFEGALWAALVCLIVWGLVEGWK